MHPHALVAYVGLVLGLFTKLIVLTTFQGLVRMRSKAFHWAEDAAHWGGTAGHVGDDERVVRAQAALRNDGENHPLMLAISGAWVALGASATAASATFGIYVVARLLHGYLLVRPRQPLRNRVYGLGQGTMLVVAIDLARRAIATA